MSEVTGKQSPSARARLAGWGRGAARPVAVGLIAGAAAVGAMAWSTPAPPVAAPVPSAGHRSVLGFTVQSPELSIGADADLRAALARRMDHFSVADVPARAAMERWARQAGVNLFAEWHNLAYWGVSTDKAISLDLHDVPAGQVLKCLVAAMEPSGRIVTYARGSVMWVGPDDSRGLRDAGRLVTRFYDVRPLVAGDVPWLELPRNDPGGWDREIIASGSLIDMLVNRVYDDAMDENSNSGCMARYWAGWLIVRNTPEAQEQVATLLDTLAERRPTTTRPAG